MVEDKLVFSDFSCPFCSCVFSSQVDLDLHLDAFGRVPHLRLWRYVHAFLDVYGSYTNVNAGKCFVPDSFLCHRDGLPCSHLVDVYGSRRRVHSDCLKCDVLPLIAK
jgi:hypothetical protein